METAPDQKCALPASLSTLQSAWMIPSVEAVPSLLPAEHKDAQRSFLRGTSPWGTHIFPALSSAKVGSTEQQKRGKAAMNIMVTSLYTPASLLKRTLPGHPALSFGQAYKKVPSAEASILCILD